MSHLGERCITLLSLHYLDKRSLSLAIYVCLSLWWDLLHLEKRSLTLEIRLEMPHPDEICLILKQMPHLGQRCLTLMMCLILKKKMPHLDKKCLTWMRSALSRKKIPHLGKICMSPWGDLPHLDKNKCLTLSRDASPQWDLTLIKMPHLGHRCLTLTRSALSWRRMPHLGQRCLSPWWELPHLDKRGLGKRCLTLMRSASSW